MKKIITLASLLIITILITACGNSLRDGTYEFRSANVPLDEFTNVERIWLRFAQSERGIVIDGNRIQSGGGGWYYWQINNGAIEIQRSGATRWSSTPYRVRRGNLSIEFPDTGRTVTLRRR
jgi:hypothetical protein